MFSLAKYFEARLHVEYQTLTSSESMSEYNDGCLVVILPLNEESFPRDPVEDSFNKSVELSVLAIMLPPQHL